MIQMYWGRDMYLYGKRQVSCGEIGRRTYSVKYLEEVRGLRRCETGGKEDSSKVRRDVD